MSTTPHSGNHSSGSDQDIQNELHRVRGEASGLASSAAETARTRGRETVDDAKRRAADGAESLASAIERTAEDLGSENGNEAVSDYGRNVASMMRRFAGGLREQDIDDLASQLATFARRNPATFLAGSVALGFGLSRFLKSSSQRSAEDYGYAGELDYDDLDYDDYEPGFSADSADDSFESTRTSPGQADFGSEATGTWPEDRERERPGAASASQHWTPGTSGTSGTSSSAGTSGSAGTSSASTPSTASPGSSSGDTRSAGLSHGANQTRPGGASLGSENSYGSDIDSDRRNQP